jgi:hypothetical protein
VVPESLKPAIPVVPQRGQELLRHLHRRGVEPVADPPPLTGFGGHETRVGQQH